MDEPFSGFSSASDQEAWPYSGSGSTCAVLCGTAAIVRQASCMQMFKDPFDPSATAGANRNVCLQQANDFAVSCIPACAMAGN